MNNSIILGVTGGIAAYKSAEICSHLTAAGISVHVVMTQNALKLVSERLFFTLSRNRVTVDLWKTPQWEPEHIQLAEQAELMLVAPATANFIGKYANGIADDALTTVALAFTGKMVIAPAMNPKMWQNKAVQRNCAQLLSDGVEFIGPEEGRLACGTFGAGRLADIVKIESKVFDFFKGRI